MARAKAAQAAKSRNTKTMKQMASSSQQQDAESLLKADHRKVEALFEQFKQADEDQKPEIVEKVCNELIVHTLLEEEIFYPACREKEVEDDLLDEAQVEHDGAKVLIAQLLEAEPDEEYYDAQVTVLSEYIKHHVAEEEKPGEGIFAKAKKKGVDMAGLGKRLKARKMELMQKVQSGRIAPPQPRSFDLGQMQQRSSQQGFRSGGRGQDDYGYQRSAGDRGSSRFRDEDEDYRGRSSGWYGESQNGRSRGQEQDRSERRSREDERSYRGSSREEDEGRGWYGDTRGHSEAAREGWEHRGRRSREDDDDDDRGRGGWFGDPRGHAQAARRGWRNRD